MAAVFKGLGFQVVEGVDLDKAAFDRKIRDFAAALQGAELGVFFYAGHGLQVGGQNYLVPTDAELSSQLNGNDSLRNSPSGNLFVGTVDAFASPKKASQSSGEAAGEIPETVQALLVDGIATLQHYGPLARRYSFVG